MDSNVSAQATANASNVSNIMLPMSKHSRDGAAEVSDNRTDIHSLALAWMRDSRDFNVHNIHGTSSDTQCMPCTVSVQIDGRNNKLSNAICQPTVGADLRRGYDAV